LRASSAAYWRFLKKDARVTIAAGVPLLIGALFTAVSALFYSHSHPDLALTELAAAIGIAVLLVVALFAYQGVYLLTGRLYFDSGWLIRTAWLSRRRKFRVDDIGRIRRRSIAMRGRAQPAYLVENKRGQLAFWLLAFRWDESALETLWRRIGSIPTGSWSDHEDYEVHSDLPRW
jgi:hypothetical protein